MSPPTTKVTTRLILIDPAEATRNDVLEVLWTIGSLWVAEVGTSMDDAARLARESAAPVVLLVLDADPARGLIAIREIASAAPKAAIIPASRSRDGDLILAAIRAGASEFLTLPLTADELVPMIERIAPRPEQAAGRAGSSLIAVTGASGGVGCTTLAVNLSVALARRPGSSAALCDLDLLLGIVDSSLDLHPEHTLFDVASQVDRLDLTLLRRALARHASGLHVLACPATMEEAACLEPAALRHVIELMKQAFHAVVLDTGKGFSATDFLALEMADTIAMVIELELNCLRNSTRLLRLLKSCGDLDRKVKLVANRVGSSTGGISIKKAEETLGLPVAWQLPNATALFSAARAKGVALEAEAQNSRPHRVFQDLAVAFGPAPPAGASPPPPKAPLRRFAAMFS